MEKRRDFIYVVNRSLGNFIQYVSMLVSSLSQGKIFFGVILGSDSLSQKHRKHLAVMKSCAAFMNDSPLLCQSCDCHKLTDGTLPPSLSLCHFASFYSAFLLQINTAGDSDTHKCIILILYVFPLYLLSGIFVFTFSSCVWCSRLLSFVSCLLLQLLS